ncbi:seven-hairpin glycosidase [Martensiomyces pterosporus]|nr:seven-hairpin glycosidase [Martensiomyces pterosporus]
MRALLVALVLWLGLLVYLAAARRVADGMIGFEGRRARQRDVERFSGNRVQATNFTHSDALQKMRANRAADVRDGFRWAWNAYRKYAFGADEINPLTKEPMTTRNGWGATLIDALDTIYIMGLTEEFNEAREKVKHINFDRNDGEPSKVFETNIRYIGGLISAYELSGDRMFLKQATSLADIMLEAFDTSTGIPWQMWDVQTGAGSSEAGPSTYNNLAEIGTYQLEFFRLSQHTHDPSYHKAAQRVYDVILDNNTPKKGNVYSVPGLYPIFLDIKTGKFLSGKPNLGGGSDSFYEYLIKTWALSGFKLQRNLDMWRESLEGIRKYIISRGSDKGLYMGIGDDDGLDSISDTFTCFFPGTLALASRLLNDSDTLDLAHDLLLSSYNTFARMPTNIGPEDFGFLPDGDDDRDLTLEQRQEIKKYGFYLDRPYYLMRPEVIESIFYFYRITGDEKYADWIWNIWQGIKANCAVDGGFAGLRDVRIGREGGLVGKQESFVFSETFKYLYLAFAEPNVISLDDYVFSTEGHPFKRSILFNGTF